ncbi:MAG: D-alanyl-D-alanine carboxypeptidase/D-alanyl-D-alanine-endopeptidase [Gemmatimonadaceae bacterium]|nr:D-alanyl-D-alanine carboxypeptidase/D-alanyl-D-alanine-endopeptidase [Gemmatimonadaceae bacterium]MCC6432613.1 D-alanyl-D-alanine carboxypeptidase/D-alanyl-D-alanine-endopeptidase [Gemmatimonadaceae bacterium]
MTRIAPRLFLSVAFVLAAGCAGRATVPAPTGGHVPEPVPPVAMPVVTVQQPPSARDVLRHLADSALGAPMWRNARWGLLIVDAATGDTLLSRDADKLFMPASNQKLLTGAVALQTLGPEYRWRTPIILRGTQRGAEFRGDVVVLGSGDPSVSDTLRGGNALSSFDPVVSALKTRGITRIRGRLLSDGDAFRGPSTGFGWEIDDLDESYGAPIDELLFNEGELRVAVFAGSAPGKSAYISTSPTVTYPAVRNEVVTRAASDTGARVRLVYDTVASQLVVTGTMVAGDSLKTLMSYRHPNDAYLAALAQRLNAGGIRFQVPPAARASKRTPRAITKRRAAAPVVPVDTLVILESVPLREVLPRMQKPSQNQIAEMLFRTSGLVGTGHGSADSARAFGARTLASWGATAEHVAYRDGSGLSRHDYVTPRAIVRVLDAMHRSPWAELYRTALPLAGVDGTLANRMKNTSAARNANAKTGTVDKARSLSGYVTTADGRVIMFSMLSNNFTVPNREVERVQDLLVRALAELRVGNEAPRAR